MRWNYLLVECTKNWFWAKCSSARGARAKETHSRYVPWGIYPSLSSFWSSTIVFLPFTTTLWFRTAWFWDIEHSLSHQLRNEWLSERCEWTSKRTSECPSAFVSIHCCFEPLFTRHQIAWLSFTHNVDFTFYRFGPALATQHSGLKLHEIDVSILRKNLIHMSLGVSEWMVRATSKWTSKWPSALYVYSLIIWLTVLWGNGVSSRGKMSF